MIGAASIERTGAHADAIEMEAAGAETLHLEAPDPAMLFCAFQPVEHATPPAAPRTDADSAAIRDRAHALIARGAFHEVRGAAAVAQPDAPRSLVAIDQQLGGGCGGGGCTIGLRYRTVEGTMPERGLSYFEQERGVRVGWRHCPRRVVGRRSSRSHPPSRARRSGAASPAGTERRSATG